MTCTATYTTTQADVNAGSIVNTGTATGTPPLGAAVTAESSVTIAATQSPAIGITKSADVVEITEEGTLITYSYEVVNAGNVDLLAVTVIDLLPGLSAVSCPETVLAPAERQTCTATYTATQADVDRGFVTNVGTATGTAPDGTEVSQSATVTIPAVSNPAITLVKSAVPTSFAAAGTLITYSYLVTNTGNVTLDAVDVSDLAPGLSAVTCPAGPLAPNASVTCTATYTTTQVDVDRGSISNTGTATGTAPDGTVVTAESSTTVPAVGSPAITLVKSANPSAFAAPGTTITYSYLVANTGNLTVSNVDVTDPAPGLSPITCPATSLAPSESVTCTATYTTTQTDVDRGSITNTGTATGTAPDGTELTATSTTTVPALLTPAITVAKTASPPGFTAAGETITYSYLVTNTGNVTLAGIEVTDPAPGLSTVTCPDVTLAPGASVTCTATYVTSQTDVDNGSITNTGTASGTTPGGTEVTAESTLTVTATQTPSISLTKEATASTFASVGTPIIYTYTVTNTGNVTLDPVVVTDPMPGLTAISCPLPSLAPGASVTCTATYTTTQADVDNGSITNTGTATGTAPDTTQVQASDTEVVPLVQTPAIAIAKEASVAEFSTEGTDITFTYTVVNNGNVTLDPVTVTDPLPGLSAISCPDSSLAPTDETTCTATYTTTQADVDAGFVTNTGTATGTTPAGTDVTDTATVTIPAVRSPALDFTKSADTDTFSEPGIVITYTFVVENTGNVTLSPVVVTDPLPGLSPISCPSDTLAPGDTLTCTATYTTTQADVDAGSVTNAATVTATPPGGVPPVTDGSEVTVPADQAPAISITKSASVTDFDAPNTSITYTYVVENTGNVTLDPVSVTDPHPGLSALSCPPATLAPGATLTCTATYVTTQADVDLGAITNTGTASGIPPSGDAVTGTSTVDVPATQTPALTIEKSADVGSFALPDTQITFHYLVTNTGNVTIDGISVADSLPGVSAVTCPDITLAPGASTTCTATYTTTQADLDAGGITNTGTATGTAPDGTTVTGNDTLDVPAVQHAAITLTKSADVISFPAAGTPITFTYTVRNAGNVTLEDVGVTDSLPGLSVVTCLPPAPATLVPGDVQTCTATYTTTQADVNLGSLTNAATATGTAPDGSTVDDDASVTVPAIVTPGIKLVKSADVATFVVPGTTITYSYEITNTGNVDLTDVGVTDPMPGLVPVPPSCPVTTLAPGESTTCTATYTTTQEDIDRGSIVNTGTASGTPPNALPPVTATSTVDIPLSAMSISKSAAPTGFTTAGTTIVYSYVVTNTGATLLDPVVVTDPMPGLSAISCPGTSLAAGASMTCSATYLTTEADVTAGSVSNTATATGTGPDDTTVTAADTFTLPGLPDILLVKSADMSSFSTAGTLITYTFVVTNIGAQPLVTITITDVLIPASSIECPASLPLAVGASMTCTATYTTTEADVAEGAVRNTATAGGTATGFPPVTSSSSVVSPVTDVLGGGATAPEAPVSPITRTPVEVTG
jgi:uncharacterized repeat protein (TIGR01451 family)